MMDLLRNFSKSWLSLLLIGLLILSFAIWGISGSLFFGAQTTVAKVGDTTVDVHDYRFAYDQQFAILSQNFGGRLTQAQADAIGLRNNVLEQVVSGAVLDETSRRMGLGISDDEVALEIARDPNLQDFNGNFSRSALQASLRRAGISENEYIQSRKLVSLRNQFIQGTASSLAMPKAYIDALTIYRNEQRIFDYVVLGSEVAGEVSEPTDSQISDFYGQKKQDYVAPEYRKLAILKIEPADVTKPEEVTDADLQAAYEARSANLRTPERREIEQLVLNAGTQEEVARQLADGVSFETIVEDQGKTLADINLGTLVESGLPDQKVADAAFAAELNKPTEIIDGLFGPVVVRVTKIEEEKVTPFEEVKEQLRNEIALERGGEEIFATFDAVEDERGAGETVLATADKLGLTARTIDAIDASGLDKSGEPVADIPALRNLLSEAFQAEPGDDTQAIEIGSAGFLWFDVLEITPERQKPLDEVRDDVIAAWKSLETDGQIEAVANRITDRVKTGEDFNAVLADMLDTDSLGQDITFKTSEPLARRANTPDIPANAVAAGFDMAEGEFDIVPLGENRFMILRVAKIEQQDNALEEQIVERLEGEASQDIIVQIVNDLRSRADVTVNQGAVDLALSPGGYAHGGH